MKYEWDSHKAIINLLKHGIQFADAVAVFEDSAAITILDDYPQEERYITIGMDTLANIVVVVYTQRNDVIRIISARKATPSECRIYSEAG
jgi:uncharacterized protein